MNLLKSESKPTRAWSLLNRLIGWYGVSFLILLFAANGFLYFSLVRGLKSQHVSILNDRMKAVASLLESPDRGLDELAHRILHEWPNRGGEAVYLLLSDGNGKVILKTPGFPSALEDEIISSASKKVSVPLTWLEPDKGSFTGKQVELKNALGLKEPVILYAFIGDEVNQSFLATYRSIAIIVLFLSMVASVAIAWLIARKGVEPLKRIEKEVGGLGSHTLHKRIELLDLPIELTGLVSALNQTLDRLEDSFNRMSTFSADIAHELRTPIANVLGEIEVTLSRPRLEAEYRETLSSTLEECERIAQIIESLLFLARAENFKKELNLETVQVKSDIQSLIEFFEPSASEKGITLFAFSTSESSVPAVLAERVLFQRVLANLISNSIRYTNNGGKIIIKYEALGKDVVITVSDNGVGIAAEHLSNIFDRFYRVDPSRAHNSGGFGLGLTIVKTIVQVHGGKIEVKSKVGQGTDVEIRWPAVLSSI